MGTRFQDGSHYHGVRRDMAGRRQAQACALARVEVPVMRLWFDGEWVDVPVADVLIALMFTVALMALWWLYR